jgi:hypothetical protein
VEVRFQGLLPSFRLYQQMTNFENNNCTFTISINGTDSAAAQQPMRSLQFALDAAAAANLTDIDVCYLAGDFDSIAFSGVVPLASLALHPRIVLRGQQGPSVTRALFGINLASALNFQLISHTSIVDIAARGNVSLTGSVRVSLLNDSLESGTLSLNATMIDIVNSQIESDIQLAGSPCSFNVSDSTIARRNANDSFVLLSLAGAYVTLDNVTLDGVHADPQASLLFVSAQHLTTLSLSGQLNSSVGFSIIDSQLRSCPRPSSEPFFAAYCGEICLHTDNVSLPSTPCTVECNVFGSQMHAQLNGFAFCVPCGDGLAVAANNVDCFQCPFGKTPALSGHGCMNCTRRSAWSDGVCIDCPSAADNFTCIQCTSFSVSAIFRGICPFDFSDILMSIAIIVIVFSFFGGISWILKKIISNRRQGYEQL